MTHLGLQFSLFAKNGLIINRIKVVPSNQKLVIPPIVLDGELGPCSEVFLIMISLLLCV